MVHVFCLLVGGFLTFGFVFLLWIVAMLDNYSGRHDEVAAPVPKEKKDTSLLWLDEVDRLFDDRF